MTSRYEKDLLWSGLFKSERAVLYTENAKNVLRACDTIVHTYNNIHTEYVV